MTVLNVLIFFSSFSFFIYGLAFFTSTKMKSEFKRFGLEKVGALTAVLELLGAIGLLLGLKFQPLLLLASGGLALLMFFGVVVRIKIGDSLWVSLPALLFMIINGFIFYSAIFT
jgi:hypothetical protein